MEGILQLKTSRTTPWRERFAVVDIPSRQLRLFRNASQQEARGVCELLGGEVHALSLAGSDDGRHFAFAVTSAGGKTRYLSARTAEDAAQWMRALEGLTRPPGNEVVATSSHAAFEFHAKIMSWRDVEGDHAEYEVRCGFKHTPSLATRAHIHTWSVWRRFSQFHALDEAMRLTQGWHMDDIKFPPRKRKFLRGRLYGSRVEEDWVRERMALLSSYFDQLLALPQVTDFVKHHCDADLKAFVDFDAEFALAESGAAAAEAAAAATATDADVEEEASHRRSGSHGGSHRRSRRRMKASDVRRRRQQALGGRDPSPSRPAPAPAPAAAAPAPAPAPAPAAAPAPAPGPAPAPAPAPALPTPAPADDLPPAVAISVAAPPPTSGRDGLMAAISGGGTKLRAAPPPAPAPAPTSGRDGLMAAISGGGAKLRSTADAPAPAPAPAEPANDLLAAIRSGGHLRPASERAPEPAPAAGASAEGGLVGALSAAMSRRRTSIAIPELPSDDDDSDQWSD